MGSNIDIRQFGAEPPRTGNASQPQPLEVWCGKALPGRGTRPAGHRLGALSGCSREGTCTRAHSCPRRGVERRRRTPAPDAARFRLTRCASSGTSRIPQSSFNGVPWVVEVISEVRTRPWSSSNRTRSTTRSSAASGSGGSLSPRCDKPSLRYDEASRARPRNPGA